MKRFHRPPGLLKMLISSVVWELPLQQKKIFLTFDDGPHPEVTPEVLNLLARYQAEATFFMLGKNVEQYPELMTRVINEGHEVGNHSWSHPDGWKTQGKDYLEDVKRATAVIPSALFRPPYGRLKPRQYRQLRKANYQVVMWSYLTGDYRTDIPRDILLQRAVAAVAGGSVVVFHDSPQASGNCLFLLEAILNHFSLRGFTFEKLSPNLGGIIRK